MVIFISTPHTSHRYFRLILRSSPVGGGSGGSIVMLRSIAMPLFHRMYPKKIPNPTQIIVDTAGTKSSYLPRRYPFATAFHQPDEP